jgi:valyl-tRNA synthetase
MAKERTELSTRYDPSEFEQKWYEAWDKAGYFTTDPKSPKPKYTVVIPPPNVTGRLHIGHALVNTLIDVRIRWKRMCGYDALFLPGTDHAGIATQMVVERELEKEGTSRLALGREAFVERVWKWKDDHGSQIKEQLKRLGASCDWTREHFTLDEDLSRAVRRVFVTLHQEGLIYRDLAMINWCPRCHTAISDLEVEYEERDGRLWEIHYPLSDGSGRLTVATTRPETMLGDTGLGVHPDDERYKRLVGATAKLPLTDREIPIVADQVLVDMEFGTGVVKITPAHDRNDYEAGHRNGLAQLKVIDEDGRMTEAAGPDYAGLTREDARKKVVADLEAKGLLASAKPYRHSVGYCGRCATTIEPMISRQWFVKIEPLAGPALEVVKNGTITITPSSWTSTYYNWMENIHDWCISRQLWWGHRIPAFYCECGHTMVTEADPTRCDKCGSSAIAQETDVLDTWFSSALWPFSTMGWPDDTEDFKAFYPTTTMITGFDILFFWVARMIMMGLRFTGKVPFHEVFLNGLVRDEHGQKMSKTKGNVIDPLVVSDRLGADAVRFTLSILSSGRDIPLSESRMQGYAAFATKIWNAARFALMNVDGTLGDLNSPLDTSRLDVVERWILSRCNATAAQVNKSLEAFRFDEASNAVYQFFWGDLCDWYIEMSKPVLMGREGTPEDLERARQVLLTVLDRSLRLLHPFMPFITEEIWQKLGPSEPSIMIAAYPVAEPSWDDREAEDLVAALQTIITTVRNQRASRNLSHKDPLTLYVTTDDAAKRALVESNAYLLRTLAKLSDVRIGEPAPENAHRDMVGGIEFAIELPKVEVTPEMIAKIEKEIAGLEKELAGVDGRLGNPQFVEKAPANVIEGAKARRVEIVDRLATLRRNLGGPAS